MIIIAGHATRQEGQIYEFPTITLIEVLNSQKKEFIYLRHAIDGKNFTQVLRYNNGFLRYQRYLPSIPWGYLSRYVSEGLINIVYVMYIKIRYKGNISFIGVDPLNAMCGVILHWLSLTSKTIFYSVDYSPHRFSSNLLNSIYLIIDTISAKYSSQTWNVSHRIFDIHAQLGVNKDRNVLVPNVPAKYLVTGQFHRDNNMLITLGVLDKQLDYKCIFEALKILRKQIPQLKLKIVGSGPSEVKIKKLAEKIGVKDIVIFMGYLTHDKALEEISKSGMGLALYNKKWSFNYYGDSMKCREFFSSGLPVITTNTHSTVLDIRNYKAGMIVHLNNVGDYVNSILFIVKNYNEFSSNALRLGRVYKNVHRKYLNTL